MRRVGVKRSNPEPLSNDSQGHSSIFEPRSKKARMSVSESRDERGAFRQMIDWCWSSFCGLFAALFQSGQHEAMIRGAGDEAEESGDDSYASCLEETSDMCENIDTPDHRHQHRRTVHSKVDLFSPIRLSSLNTTNELEYTHDRSLTNQSTRKAHSFVTPSHKASIQTSTPLSQPWKQKQPGASASQSVLPSSVNHPHHSSVNHPHLSSVNHPHLSSVNHPHHSSVNHPYHSSVNHPHLSSANYSCHSSTNNSHRSSVSLTLSLGSSQMNSPVVANKLATSTSIDISNRLYYPEEIGPISRRTSQPRTCVKDRGLGTYSPIDKTSRQQQARKISEISEWIQNVKSNQKDSSADRQLMVDIAEKKLQMQRAERRVLEDARVTRLRTLLEDASLTKTQAREVSLSLTAEQSEMVTMATSGGPGGECLSDKYNISITRSDLCTLTGLHWLNDNVVNFYFNMIRDRFERVHVMSSFFYPKLSQSGYTSVRRWTKKVDLFAMDIVLLPIHLGMHWCLAVIDFKAKKFSYYDSLLGNNPACLQRLRSYLENESMDKKKVQYDLRGWSDNILKNIPRQENGSDCGVFMCMYARHVAAGAPFDFSQEDMPQLRKHMICEIIAQKMF